MSLPHLPALAAGHPAALLAGAAIVWAAKAAAGYWLWGLWRARRAK